MKENATSQSQVKTPRRSSLELLRIICMIFIVAHHFGVHGRYGNMEMSELNRFIIKLFSAGGKLGVNIYVIISGYFLVNSKFKVIQVVRTVLLTVFYSVSLYVIMSLSTTEFQFSAKTLLENTFVIKNKIYWFVTCFVAMLLLSPFVNKLIHSLEEKQHLALIALLLFMQITVFSKSSYFEFSNTAWFITLYIIAGYLRLYPKDIFANKKITGSISLALCILLVFWKSATEMKDFFCLLASLSLFCFFNHLNMKTNRVINKVSKTTFGIYLIHDNDFVRIKLWGDYLNCPFHATLDNFWLFAISSVISVFVVCSVIELVRIFVTQVLKKLIKNLLTKRQSQSRQENAPTSV